MIKALVLKNYLIYIVLGVLLWSMGNVAAQNLKFIKKDVVFRYEYETLRTDTAVRNGYYRMFYKDKILERGQYLKGDRVGLWRFYNLQGIFEFEFDYATRSVTRMSDNIDVTVETPCLYLGSPFIPYHYLRNIEYPQEAYEQKLKGKVVLTLKITKEGKLESYYLSEKLHPVLDAEVLKVVAKFPPQWEWVPATRMGQLVESEYVVTIYFDGDEDKK